MPDKPELYRIDSVEIIQREDEWEALAHDGWGRRWLRYPALSEDDARAWGQRMLRRTWITTTGPHPMEVT